MLDQRRGEGTAANTTASCFTVMHTYHHLPPHLATCVFHNTACLSVSATSSIHLLVGLLASSIHHALCALRLLITANGKVQAERAAYSVVARTQPACSRLVCPVLRLGQRPDQSGRVLCRSPRGCSYIPLQSQN